MKLKRIVTKVLAAAMVITTLAPLGTPTTVSAAPSNLVPDKTTGTIANYTCTWNIQDWVAYHELDGDNSSSKAKNHKREVVDPGHLFDKEQGWITTMYPKTRGDMLFLLDDGWDIPYGHGSNKGDEYFASQVMPDDKFPKKEWGDTPQEKLKTLNEKIKAEGWAGTGIWICARRSKGYKEYEGKDEEDFWRMRLRWSKYAGIAYWKIDWGSGGDYPDRMKDIEWRRKISEWAEEEYPELIIEGVYGGSGGYNKENNRFPQKETRFGTDIGAHSDVYRTYDVYDQLMTPITLERVSELLKAGYTEEGPAMGLINAEDEMYIAASLGLTVGVMRHTPYLVDDSTNNKKNFANGTVANTYYAGGVKFAESRATRSSLDEVDRTLRWQRIAPAYAMGDYDTKVSNEYFSDQWKTADKEPFWDKSTGTKTQKAPAVIARGIDLPTVKVSSGDKPFLTASRNPNGAISIATHARTNTKTGYTVNKTAEVSLNAGDLTGKIGIFGYYGKLNLTFNQDLKGKKVYAQDLLADKAEDITSKVKINGKTITIEGDVLEDIGLAKATKDDRSLPGLVMQIGEESDFKKAPATNARLKRWDVNNSSFERFSYEGNNGQSLSSVTGAGWYRENDTAASYISKGGKTGDYCGIHKKGSDYEATTYQVNGTVEPGVYKVSCWVKSSGITRTGSKRETSAGLFVRSTNKEFGDVKTVAYADIAKLGKLDDWTYVEIPRVQFTGNHMRIELYTYGKKNEYVMFDDVKVEKYGDGASVGTVNPVVKFDFSKTSSDKVYGIANGKEITATAQNVTFKTDEDGNDVAVFEAGGDNKSTGITYSPGNDDPMKTLTSGNGATVSVWMKAANDKFSSPLVCYGALQSSGTLGASMDIHVRNDVGGDVMYYRNDKGSTNGHKVTEIGKPYKKNTWQLVTYVEEWDGTGTFYVDGEKKGTCKSSDKTLLGYATDKNSPDNYYIGYLPYETEDDTHFEGSIDSVTIYDSAMTESQVKALYEERNADQTTIELKADGDGLVSGKAADEFKRGQGYVSWMGKNDGAEEGAVTFNFTAKTAGEWNVDVTYLSQQERDFVITTNGDREKAVTVKCGAGTSWNDVKKAVSVDAGNVTLKKGTNTITIGNPNGTAPSLVKVTLTRADYVEAKEVEAYISSNIGMVDDFMMLDLVCNARAKYDALTKEQQAMVSKEAYNMLLSAEDFMSSGLTDDDRNQSKAVKDAIDAIGEVTLEKEDKIKAAREAYDKLGETPKKMITDDYVAKLTDAEKKLEELKKNPEGGNGDQKDDPENGNGDQKDDPIDPPVTEPANTYQAENAARTAACVVSESASCSNGKFVGELGGSKGGKVTFTVNAEKAGKYDVDIYYITHYDRNFEVTVNGGAATTVACAGNNTDWDRTVAKATTSVELKAGVNTIALGNANDFAPNLDMIVLTLKEATDTDIEVNKDEQELATAKAALQAVAEAAGSYKKENYTEDSWTAFETALTAAKVALDNADAKTEDYNNAKDALTAAINSLAKVEQTGDDFVTAKTTLNEAVAAAKEAYAKGADAYTEETWQPFAKAYADATNPTALATATAEELTALATALDAAQKALVKEEQPTEDTELKKAQEALATAVAEAKAIIDKGQDEYTEDTWTEFKNAYDAAANPAEGATAEALNELKDKLTAAKDALKKTDAEPTDTEEALKAAEEALEKAVEDASEAYDAGAEKYTEESWKAFEDAYDAAMEPGKDATVKKLTELKDALDTALKALEEKGAQKPDDEQKPDTSTIPGTNQNDNTNTNPNATQNPSAGNQQNSAVSTAPTAEETKIMNTLGVTADVAKQISAVVTQNKVSEDTLAVTDTYVKNVKSEGDLPGSTFSKLQAKAQKQTRNSVKLKWEKVAGADGYLVYGAKCGNSNAYELLGTVTGGEYTHKKLNKGTNYKYLVCAYKEVAGTKVTLAVSKTIHTVTKGSKYGVAKAVSVNKTKVNLKVGKSARLIAKELKAGLKVKNHRKLSFESDNTAVATVAKNGKIKATGKGTCYVYAYAQNGVCKKVRVTVK